jgi:dethiobiotin synthetase
MHGFFVTGTDTGVGKTQVALGLLALMNGAGLRTLAMKPISSGCMVTPGGLRNEDALRLEVAASEAVPYTEVNPFAYAPAIAPHIAADEAGDGPRVTDLVAAFNTLLRHPADAVVVEGAGGWRVPINPDETLADFAREIGLPVVLVVGMRLGCLNHALLSAEAIRRDGLVLAGWVANQVDGTMARAAENLATLERLMPGPCLGVVPHLPAPTADLMVASLDNEAVLGHLGRS